ncbi:MAG: hypothetical protein IMF01_06465 [Proteobacteria bacterium]|nr:hypothetical protein [Pseudomonadota bacterium]
MRHIVITALFILSTFTFVFLPDITEARQITGQGYGKTEKEAKREALGDLSLAIQANIQSEFKQLVTVIAKGGDEDVETTSNKLMQVKSELPILGAEFTLSPLKKEIMAQAILDFEDIILYEEKLSDFIKEADSYLVMLKKARSSGKEYDTLMSLLALVKQFYKYKIVAVMLNSKKVPDFPITEAEVRERVRRLGIMVKSIDLAAKLISKGIKKEKIYIYPPVTRGSHEVTQFASVVRHNLATYLRTAQSPKDADYFMIGEYEIAKDGIELVYHLSDINFNTIGTKIVTLAPKSYASYETKPKTINFDKLLYEGYVVSGDFRVDVSTDRGRESLLFESDDNVELFVKMNRPGYLYLVGHVIKEKAKYSYIIDIQEGVGGRKFIYYINADDVNKWMSLGKFEVIPPFGVESLQMIASSHDLVEHLPSYKYNNKLELFVVDKNPEKGLMKTRAIKKKIDRKYKLSENVLMFTTMKGYGN